MGILNSPERSRRVEGKDLFASGVVGMRILVVSKGMIYQDNLQQPYFVYILLCNDKSYYVGLTNDVLRRFDEHQAGQYETCYTFKRRPLQLMYYETIPFLEDAVQRELQLKRWSGNKKKALIEQHYHKLQLLTQYQNLSHHKYKDIK